MGILEDLKEIDRLISEVDPIEIVLLGKVPSKKNRYRPRKGGKGFFKDSTLQDELDRLALQIPAEARDLRLRHPAIDFYFTYTKANYDRDNACQCLLDLLVSPYRVLEDDNIAQCNGTITIHPAVRGEQDSVRIVLTPSATLDKSR
jgi:hypothetical protein